ncbi:NAD-dependent epimerase/dehydratase family protein [Haliea sp. E17]|uniref:NAD-dependent epimerase/dehydratase family protein n=1 Tax=Haliea sp. E17 TaxID=3401576 RepID=UPI003AAFBABB
MNGPVLLTGATGFVGRQLYRLALQRNMEVRLVLRRNDGPGADVVGDAAVSVVYTDDLFQESGQWWREACDGVDTVIHPAWFAAPGEYLHSPLNVECLEGTLRFAKGAQAAGVRRFVGIGSCLEYDVSCGELGSDTPLLPASVYAGCKAATYLALSTFFDQMGVEFLWCRLFYLYGEGEDERRLVPYLRKQFSLGKSAVIRNSGLVRDYLDVAVAGEMIMDAADSDLTGAINVCSGKATSIGELAESIASEYQCRELLQFAPPLPDSVEPPVIVGKR